MFTLLEICCLKQQVCFKEVVYSRKVVLPIGQIVCPLTSEMAVMTSCFGQPFSPSIARKLISMANPTLYDLRS